MRLEKGLKGDLDNILLKAMRKEPQRRYASVEQFSEDLHRHLANLPVSAHEDSFRYRTEKFVRRNIVAVAAGTANSRTTNSMARRSFRDTNTNLLKQGNAAVTNRTDRALGTCKDQPGKSGPVQCSV